MYVYLTALFQCPALAKVPNLFTTDWTSRVAASGADNYTSSDCCSYSYLQVHANPLRPNIQEFFQVGFIVFVWRVWRIQNSSTSRTYRTNRRMLFGVFLVPKLSIFKLSVSPFHSWTPNVQSLAGTLLCGRGVVILPTLGTSIAMKLALRGNPWETIR